MKNREALSYSLVKLVPQVMTRLQEAIVQYLAGANIEVVLSHLKASQSSLDDLVSYFEPEINEE